MVGGTRGKKKPRKASASARPRKPVLGNDPFERGAALREPAGGQPSSTTPTATPTATPTVPFIPSEASPQATRSPRTTPTPTDPFILSVASPQATRSRRTTPIPTPLPHTARPSSSWASVNLAGLEEEARVAVSRLLPALRARLGTVAELVRLLEPPERLDRHGMDPRFAERIAPLVEFFYTTWWRVQVRGIASVPSSGPAVVVANHAGLVPWDAFVLRHALQRDHPAHRALRPLLDDQECDLPVIGTAAVRAGAVRASPEAAGRVLAAGDVLGVFPEGSAAGNKPWRDRYTLVRFGRGGFVKVALRAGAPIVPCAIVGSEEASAGISRTGWLAERLGVPLLAANSALRLAPAAVLPLPSRWTLRFGEPVETASLGPDAAGDPGTVNRLTEQIRTSIQAMLDEDVASRTAVFL